MNEDAEEALNLDPSYIKAYGCWGEALVELGKNEHDGYSQI